MNVQEKLDRIIENKKIPHIIFHGESFKKMDIIEYFVNKIYSNDKELIKRYVLYVNCAHGKGIKFIRVQLKFFAKINIKKNIGIFKSIILLNADKLTTDAQSALRRCIEQFSHTTRFFMVIFDRNKILKPILSRFCNIYIPNNETYLVIKDQKKHKWLEKQMKKKYGLRECIKLSSTMYEKGYHIFDLFNFIREDNTFNDKTGEILHFFDNLRLYFRNEKMIMFYILHCIMRKLNIL